MLTVKRFSWTIAECLVCFQAVKNSRKAGLFFLCSILTSNTTGFPWHVVIIDPVPCLSDIHTSYSCWMECRCFCSQLTICGAATLFLKVCRKDFLRWGETFICNQRIKTSKGITSGRKHIFRLFIALLLTLIQALTICLNIMKGVCVHIPGPFKLRSKAVVDIIKHLCIKNI